MKRYYIIFIILIIITILFNVFVINNQNIKSYIRIKKAQNYLNKYELYPQEDAVNIVAITDKSYIDPLNVTIYSAIKNKDKKSKYNFYIIGINLNDDNIKELTKQSTKETPIIVVPNKNIYDFSPFKHSSHVPISDCFKFNIPDIFPNFDKMLYLDGDIIVQKDLTELYNTDVGDNYLAAHLYDYKPPSGQKGLKLKHCFNNGVMLLNLKKMRKDNIPDKLLKCKIFTAPRYMITQDVFNLVIKSKVKTINVTYNICPEYLLKPLKYNSKYVESGAIIHYAGKRKPWNYPDMRYGYIWNKYNQELANIKNFNHQK